MIRPTTGVAEFVNRPLVAIADMSSSVESQRVRRRSPRCFPRRSAVGKRVVVLQRPGERLVRHVRMEQNEEYLDHVEIVMMRMYVVLVTSLRVLLLSSDNLDVRTHWCVRRGDVKISIQDTIRHIRTMNDRIREYEKGKKKLCVETSGEQHFHELSLENDRKSNLSFVRKVLDTLNSNDEKKGLLSADDLLPMLSRMVYHDMVSSKSSTVVYVVNSRIYALTQQETSSPYVFSHSKHKAFDFHNTDTLQKFCRLLIS